MDKVNPIVKKKMNKFGDYDFGKNLDKETMKVRRPPFDL